MLNILSGNVLYNLKLTEQIQIMDGFSMSLNNLITLTCALAAVSIIISLFALRKASRGQKKAEQAIPALQTARTQTASAIDPAVIAAITAAITMMLQEETRTGTAGAHPAAGFTIRKVRRV